MLTQSTLENPDGVFPGLTRNFAAVGYDNAYDPAVAEGVKWKGNSARYGRIDNKGIFSAREAGTVDIEASVGKVEGATSLTILGELDRIEAMYLRLGLASGATGEFFIKGFDENGYSAPIEPQDSKLTYDQSVIDVKPNEDGTYTVTPKVNEGAALITTDVNGKKAYVAVTVGLKTEVVSEMENINDWRFSTARGSGSIETTEGRTGNGIKVKFDFTQSTGTRTANTHPNQYITLPGEPQSIGLWVKGDGKGEWMSFTTRGADGTFHYLYGPYVTWTGWKQVEIPVPAGVTYPLELRTIGAIETNKNKQYKGELVYDDLSVKIVQL